MAGAKKYQQFYYEPSSGAAGTMAVVFGVLTLLHLFNLVRTRTWVLIPFFVGGLMETIGYVGRIILSGQAYDHWSQGPYIMQDILLIIAPALFAASIYMILGRIILLTNGEVHAIVRVKWITFMFVAGDVLSFFTQAIGGGIMGSSNGAHLRLGETVVTIGIAIQVLWFGFFIITAGRFNRRMKRAPTPKVQQYNLPWQMHLNALYALSLLILVRSIFRVIEFIQGNDGYLMRNEWCLYVFDSTLMFAVMVIWLIRHPSEVYALLKGNGRKAVRRVIFVSRPEMIPNFHADNYPLTNESGKA